MPLYQINIVTKQYKIDEFVDSLRALLPEFRKENGCLDCCMYQDVNEKHAFCIVAEWETREAMQQHFLTQQFKVLIGATVVLGEKFEMIVAEVVESKITRLASLGGGLDISAQGSNLRSPAVSNR
jgi:quinol monooxygenase YgiN